MLRTLPGQAGSGARGRARRGRSSPANRGTAALQHRAAAKPRGQSAASMPQREAQEPAAAAHSRIRAAWLPARAGERRRRGQAAEQVQPALQQSPGDLRGPGSGRSWEIPGSTCPMTTSGGRSCRPKPDLERGMSFPRQPRPSLRLGGVGISSADSSSRGDLKEGISRWQPFRPTWGPGRVCGPSSQPPASRGDTGHFSSSRQVARKGFIHSVPKVEGACKNEPLERANQGC